MQLLIIVNLAAVFLLAHCALYYWNQTRKAYQRLELMCDFMSYIESVKDSLPGDVRFNYEACHQQALALLEKQDGKI